MKQKMNRIFKFLPALAILFLLSSCGDKDNNGTVQETEKDKILINYPWKMASVTDLAGNTISPEKLNFQSQSLPSMEIEFVAGNKVYAKGVNDSQVINGGTWYLTDNLTILDIDISGFAGKFGIEELTNSKMRLKSTMPVSGVDQETIMVFNPVIK